MLWGRLRLPPVGGFLLAVLEPTFSSGKHAGQPLATAAGVVCLGALSLIRCTLLELPDSLGPLVYCVQIYIYIYIYAVSRSTRQ